MNGLDGGIDFKLVFQEMSIKNICMNSASESVTIKKGKQEVVISDGIV
jgi:hypothetical protein